MPSHIVVGSQFGDEGKGKLTDYFASNVDAVARYQGGTNAGHTVVVGETEYKFHLLPSGIVQAKSCFIGAGVVVDPAGLLKEIKSVEKAKKKVKLTIDYRSQIIMPYHVLLDEETEKGKNSIGTTKKGIGPCYSDRALRFGIRFFDILNKERLQKRLEHVLPSKLLFLKAKGIKNNLTIEGLTKEYFVLGKKLEKYAGDVSKDISVLLSKDKKILFEGAQGTFLDNDFGTYPFVTSSHPIAGGVFTGIGLGIGNINRVTGVVKAYTSRVGDGPFPTELENKTGKKIREIGAEFGTTTGRPRRVGWLDLPSLRTSQRLNGFTDIALTKIDVLSGIKNLKICDKYEFKGKLIDEAPANLELLDECKPIYKKMKRFIITGKEKRFIDLETNAKNYIKYIEKEIGAKIRIISIGSKRNQTITR